MNRGLFLAPACSPHHPSQGELPANDLVVVLSQRLEYSDDDGLNDMLAVDGIEGCIDSTDKQRLTTMQAQAKNIHDETSEYVRSLKRFSESLGVAGKMRRQGANSGSSASSAAAPFPTKQYPKSVPQWTDKLTKEELSACLPPNVRAVSEAFHGRWRLYYTPGQVAARNLGLVRICRSGAQVGEGGLARLLRPACRRAPHTRSARLEVGIFAWPPTSPGVTFRLILDSNRN